MNMNTLDTAEVGWLTVMNYWQLLHTFNSSGSSHHLEQLLCYFFKHITCTTSIVYVGLWVGSKNTFMYEVYNNILPKYHLSLTERSPSDTRRMPRTGWSSPPRWPPGRAACRRTDLVSFTCHACQWSSRQRFVKTSQSREVTSNSTYKNLLGHYAK